jgi:short-subunit dehydrogenase
MVERGEGHVVLVSSLSGKVPNGGGSIYSATKFGLRGFGLALRDELHGTGVGVTVVYPGFIADEGMWAETGIDLPPGVGVRKPYDVGRAVVRAVERNRAEIDVAPLALKALGRIAGIMPTPVQAAGRLMRSDEVARRLGEAQREKR